MQLCVGFNLEFELLPTELLVPLSYSWWRSTCRAAYKEQSLSTRTLTTTFMTCFYSCHKAGGSEHQLYIQLDTQLLLCTSYKTDKFSPFPSLHTKHIDECVYIGYMYTVHPNKMGNHMLATNIVHCFHLTFMTICMLYPPCAFFSPNWVSSEYLFP